MITTNTLESLAETILSTPIGHVEETVADILKRDVSFSVIEQTPIGQTEYLRKIVIAADNLPIVSATVQFDSKTIPQHVLGDLLRKKEGIGTILQKYRIIAHRQSIVITISTEGKRITRNYEVVQNTSVWFRISEEIRLDLLYSCQNC